MLQKGQLEHLKPFRPRTGVVTAACVNPWGLLELGRALKTSL